MTAVGILCDEMIATRQPTAPRERLDAVSPAYLQHLAAEDVVTVDGRRCGFGHQTLSRLLRVPGVVQQAGIAGLLAHRLGAAPVPPRPGPADPDLPPGRGSGAVRARARSVARPQGRAPPRQGPGVRDPGRRAGTDRTRMDALGAVAGLRAAGAGAGLDEPRPVVGRCLAAVLRIPGVVHLRGPPFGHRGLAGFRQRPARLRRVELPWPPRHPCAGSGRGPPRALRRTRRRLDGAAAVVHGIGRPPCEPPPLRSLPAPDRPTARWTRRAAAIRRTAPSGACSRTWERPVPSGSRRSWPTGSAGASPWSAPPARRQEATSCPATTPTRSNCFDARRTGPRQRS